MNKKEKILIILGIIFISFNLRAPITAVGSVISMIKAEYNMSSGVAGFLTTLPLLAFAVVSPFVSKISSKIGYGKTMEIGLALMLLGEIIRSYTNVVGLYVGTTFLGIGIAIGNVLIPSIIKLKFTKNVGVMTSVYTSSMCIFAAVGAGLSVPLAKGLNLGWKNAIASWIILTVFTLILWLPQLKAKGTPKKAVQTTNSSSSIWKSKTAWWVTLFMGIQSLLFYSLVAWLPTIIESKNMSQSFAGTMALTFQLMAIPATLLVPTLCDKFKNQRGIMTGVCVMYIIGMLLFLIAQNQLLLIISVVMMSLGMGGSISLAIAFISFRSADATVASQLSGMSQSAGYLLAAVGPIMIGSIFDITASWTLPIIILIALIATLFICGLSASDNKTINL